MVRFRSAAAAASAGPDGLLALQVLDGIGAGVFGGAVRKRVEHETRAAGVETYFPSLSGRTVVYKGMLAEEQVEPFFADLADERTTSSIALVPSS